MVYPDWYYFFTIISLECVGGRHCYYVVSYQCYIQITLQEFLHTVYTISPLGIGDISLRYIMCMAYYPRAHAQQGVNNVCVRCLLSAQKSPDQKLP